MQVPQNPRLPLTLLIGQAFFFGLAGFASYTAANTLFLVAYGAKLLPYVYIAIALVVLCVSYSFAELQRRRTLAQVALGVAIGFVCLYFVVWLGFTLAVGRWLSFAMMVIHQMFFLLGMMVLSMQAGQIFNVREMKRLFPMVMASQLLGVTFGSLLRPPMMAVLGPIENLLLVTCGGTLIFLTLLFVTTRQFAQALSQTRQATSRKPAKSLFYFLQKRYIALIFIYLMLSTMVMQLMQFLFSSQAQIHFDTPAKLAAFFGSFLGITLFASLLFALLLTSRLLTRFGLRFGLAVNPSVVAILLILVTVAAVFFGAIGDVVFWLLVGTNFISLLLAAGMTNPVIKIAYQALPTDERMMMQSAVEGIGTPLAFGITGIILVVFAAIGRITQLHVVLFTLLIIMLWGMVGIGAYRNYAKTLIQTLNRRRLEEADLSLEDSASFAAVERLLHRNDLREVRLALDLVEQADHPSLASHLVTLLGRAPADIQAEVLLRIARLRVMVALPAIETSLQMAPSPGVKGAALRALCALREAESVEEVAPYLDDPEPAVRLGALVGLLRDGGIAGILMAGAQLTALVQAPDPAQRTLAAQLTGEVGANNFYQPLLTLLMDDSPAVRQAALLAAQQVIHPRLLPCLIHNLADSATRSAAMAALTASGDLVVPLVERALAGATSYDAETLRRLVRVCGQIKGTRVIALLKQHLGHPNSELQHQVLLALYGCGYRADNEDKALIETALLNGVRRGLRLLCARQEMGEDAATTPLCTALTEEFNSVRQRVFLLLAFRYDARALLRAEERLARGASGERALALETLDVILASEEKALVLSLIDESRALAQRIEALAHHFELPSLERTARLAEMITDRTTWTQGWTRACAIYAAGKLGCHDLTKLIADARASNEHPVSETATWALASLNGAGKREIEIGAMMQAVLLESRPRLPVNRRG